MLYKCSLFNIISIKLTKTLFLSWRSNTWATQHVLQVLSHQKAHCPLDKNYFWPRLLLFLLWADLSFFLWFLLGRKGHWKEVTQWHSWGLLADWDSSDHHIIFFRVWSASVFLQITIHFTGIFYSSRWELTFRLDPFRNRVVTRICTLCFPTIARWHFTPAGTCDRTSDLCEVKRTQHALSLGMVILSKSKSL